MKFLNFTTRLLLTASLLFSFSLSAIAPATTFAQDSSNTQQDHSKSDDKKTVKKKSTKKPKTKITTKTVTEKKSIAFTTQKQNDSSLAQGQTKILQAGKKGTEARTYKVTYTNGKQTKKVLTAHKIKAAAIPRIIAIGTYVAPAPAPTPAPTANSYTNVDGNQIESPDSNTSGASGVCRDGSYTHAVHHQGACSSHGGVDHWL